MDPATAFQTVTAAIGIVQLARQTCLFLGRVKNARREAEGLHQKTKQLFKLCQNVDNELKLRKVSLGSEREEIGVEETIKFSLDACRQCLLNINRKLRGLANNEPIDFSTHAIQSVSFTLSAVSIQKQEKAIETNIQSLSTSLQLLQLREHAVTQERLDRLENTMNQAIAHLETIPSRTSRHSHSLESKIIYKTDEPTEAQAERLGIQSLKKCIDTVKSIHSSYGSTIAPDNRSLAPIEYDISSDDDEVEDDSDDKDKRVDDLVRATQPAVSTSTSPTLDPMEDADDWSDDDEDLDMVPYEMKELMEQAEKEFLAKNYDRAEINQEKAIRHGEALEEMAERKKKKAIHLGNVPEEKDKPFHDLPQMRQRLVDIYMKQSKYAEAAKITHSLLRESKPDRTPEGRIKRADQWLVLAQTHHSKYSTNNSRNHEAAERDLETALEYAHRKSYTIIRKLVKTSAIDKSHPSFQNCINLVIRIMEDLDRTVEARAWRKMFLSPDTPTSPTSFGMLDFPLELESHLELLDQPGRTRLINSIIYNLPDELQQMLNKAVDVNERCKDGLTPIMYAVSCQHSGTGDCGCEIAIRKLVDCGADINAPTGEHGETAMHKAVEASNPRMLQLLLELGAKKEAATPRTPLSKAVKTNQSSAAAMLIKHGANVQVVDGNRWTLLHHAVFNNATQTLMTLLHQKEIDIEAKCCKEHTALFICAENAQYSQKLGIAKILLREGANIQATASINPTDPFGSRTILFYAVFSKPWGAPRQEFVKFLLDNGAPLDWNIPEKTYAKYSTLRNQFTLARRDSWSSSSNRRNSEATTTSAESTKTTDTRFSLSLLRKSKTKKR